MVTALKQSKRFGEKAFQNVDTTTLNHIGKAEKATKMFDNLNALDAGQIPHALNFFPNNLNTNVIWLGMDDIKANKVLTCGDLVCNKYNAIVENTDYTVNFSDKAKDLETKLNNLLHSSDKNLAFNSSEKIALLKETLPPAEKTKVRNVASVIEEKVMQKGQAERVVLNLDDWNGNVDELVRQLNDYPIEG